MFPIAPIIHGIPLSLIVVFFFFFSSPSKYVKYGVGLSESEKREDFDLRSIITPYSLVTSIQSSMGVVMCEAYMQRLLAGGADIRCAKGGFVVSFLSFYDSLPWLRNPLHISHATADDIEYLTVRVRSLLKPSLEQDIDSRCLAATGLVDGERGFGCCCFFFSLVFFTLSPL